MVHWLRTVLIIIVLLPLGSCLQTPNERAAISGDDVCISISDVLTIGSAPLLSVDPARPDVGITTWAVERTETMMAASTKKIYESMANNSQWRDIINTLVALTIVLYALAVMTGITQASGYVLAMTAIKIGFVWVLATQWDVFYELVVFNVENVVRFLAGTMANAFSQGVHIPSIYQTSVAQENNLFLYVDQVVSLFFSGSYWRIIMASFTSGWTGPIYGILLLFVMGTYLFAVIDTIKIYLVALITRALLFAMAPFFLIFLLFKQTKSLFDGWVEQLISFSLQPIFAMAFIGMFQMIYMGFMAGLVPELHSTQKVCYDTVAELSGWVPYMYFDTFGDGSQGAPKLDNLDAELPLNIWVILVLLLLSSLMVSMISWSVEVASRISGGFISAFDVPIEGWNQFKTNTTNMVQRAVGLTPTNAGSGRVGSSLDDERHVESMQNRQN